MKSEIIAWNRAQWRHMTSTNSYVMAVVLEVLIAGMPELGEPVSPPHPIIFGRHYNQGEQILPTLYYWHPKLNSPSGVTVLMYLLVSA